MAAQIETMFFTREKPWHGLGVRVNEATTSKEALTLSGLEGTAGADLYRGRRRD